MLVPGYSYTLTAVRYDDQGIWLDAAGKELLLPRHEAPKEIRIGSEVTVFLYLDRSNQLCATTRKPLAEVGAFALLQVKSVASQGAFLDWGLDKDLFIPRTEQSEPMHSGRRYLVHICHDRDNRPIASAKLDRFLLQENRDLTAGDQVDLLIWTFTDLGAKVIINQLYSGLLYQDDLLPGLKRGDQLKGYVARVRDDGKLDVTLQPPGAAGIDAAQSILLERLRQTGFLPLTDNSPPELIRSQLGLSKKLFKKAVGGLYKEGKISLDDDGIRLAG